MCSRQLLPERVRAGETCAALQQTPRSIDFLPGGSHAPGGVLVRGKNVRRSHCVVFCLIVKALLIGPDRCAESAHSRHVLRPGSPEKIPPPEIMVLCENFGESLESAISAALLVGHRNRQPLAKRFLLVLFRVLRPQSALGFLLQKKSGSE